VRVLGALEKNRPPPTSTPFTESFTNISTLFFTMMWESNSFQKRVFGEVGKDSENIALNVFFKKAVFLGCTVFRKIKKQQITELLVY
jgi:hypothetical protein